MHDEQDNRKELLNAIVYICGECSHIYGILEKQKVINTDIVDKQADYLKVLLDKIIGINEEIKEKNKIGTIPCPIVELTFSGPRVSFAWVNDAGEPIIPDEKPTYHPQEQRKGGYQPEQPHEPPNVPSPPPPPTPRRD